MDIYMDTQSGDVATETGLTLAVQSLVIGAIFIDGAQKNDLLLNSIGTLFTPGSHSTITAAAANTAATVGVHTAQTAVGAALPLVFVCMLLMASKMVTSGYIEQSGANQQALNNISDDNKRELFNKMNSLDQDTFNLIHKGVDNLNKSDVYQGEIVTELIQKMNIFAVIYSIIKSQNNNIRLIHNLKQSIYDSFKDDGEISEQGTITGGGPPKAKVVSSLPKQQSIETRTFAGLTATGATQLGLSLLLGPHFGVIVGIGGAIIFTAIAIRKRLTNRSNAKAKEEEYINSLYEKIKGMNDAIKNNTVIKEERDKLQAHPLLKSISNYVWKDNPTIQDKIKLIDSINDNYTNNTKQLKEDMKQLQYLLIMSMSGKCNVKEINRDRLYNEKLPDNIERLVIKQTLVKVNETVYTIDLKPEMSVVELKNKIKEKYNINNEIDLILDERFIPEGEKNSLYILKVPSYKETKYILGNINFISDKYRGVITIENSENRKTIYECINRVRFLMSILDLYCHWIKNKHKENDRICGEIRTIMRGYEKSDYQKYNSKIEEMIVMENGAASGKISPPVSDVSSGESGEESPTDEAMSEEASVGEQQQAETKNIYPKILSIDRQLYKLYEKYNVCDKLKEIDELLRQQKRRQQKRRGQKGRRMPPNITPTRGKNLLKEKENIYNNDEIIDNIFYTPRVHMMDDNEKMQYIYTVIDILNAEDTTAAGASSASASAAGQVTKKINEMCARLDDELDDELNEGEIINEIENTQKLNNTDILENGLISKKVIKFKETNNGINIPSKFTKLKGVFDGFKSRCDYETIITDRVKEFIKNRYIVNNKEIMMVILKKLTSLFGLFSGYRTGFTEKEKETMNNILVKNADNFFKITYGEYLLLKKIIDEYNKREEARNKREREYGSYMHSMYNVYGSKLKRKKRKTRRKKHKTRHKTFKKINTKKRRKKTKRKRNKTKKKTKRKRNKTKNK